MSANPWEKSTCCCPMWMAGLPAGYCGEPAFGPQLPEAFYNWRRIVVQNTGQIINGWPHVYGHACPVHQGPAEGEPIIFRDGTGANGKPMYCAVMPGFVDLQESHAEFDQDPRKAVARLTKEVRR